MAEATLGDLHFAARAAGSWAREQERERDSQAEVAEWQTRRTQKPEASADEPQTAAIGESTQRDASPKYAEPTSRPLAEDPIAGAVADLQTRLVAALLDKDHEKAKRLHAAIGALLGGDVAPAPVVDELAERRRKARGEG